MKKRRSEGSSSSLSGLEDAERSLHASFCSAANSISHLYTQAHTQNKIAFHTGQRYSLEKLCEWMQKYHHEFGSLPASTDILNYAKNELDNINHAPTTVTQVQNAFVAPHHAFGRAP